MAVNQIHLPKCQRQVFRHPYKVKPNVLPQTHAKRHEKSPTTVKKEWPKMIAALMFKIGIRSLIRQLVKLRLLFSVCAQNLTSFYDVNFLPTFHSSVRSLFARLLISISVSSPEHSLHLSAIHRHG